MVSETSATGEVYVEYRIGSNTEPCGTPQVSLRFDDFSSPTLTNCVLCWKNTILSRIGPFLIFLSDFVSW